VEKGKTALAAAEKALATVKQREATAADDAARAALKGEAAAAQTGLDNAKKALQGADAKLQQLAKVEDAAVKAVAAAETKAKERSQQYASYSLPITVEVTPAPEKK